VNSFDQEYFIRMAFCTWHCTASKAAEVQVIITTTTKDILTTGLLLTDATAATKKQPPKPNQQGEKAESLLIQLGLLARS